MEAIKQAITEISAALAGAPDHDALWRAHQKSMALEQQLRSMLVNRSAIGHLDRLGRTETRARETAPYAGRVIGSNFE